MAKRYKRAKKIQLIHKIQLLQEAFSGCKLLTFLEKSKDTVDTVGTETFKKYSLRTFIVKRKCDPGFV